MMYVIVTNSSLGRMIAYLCYPGLGGMAGLAMGKPGEPPTDLQRPQRMATATPRAAWLALKEARITRPRDGKGKRLNQPQGRMRKPMRVM